MLNNVEFVMESIGTGLFYLRNIRDFCVTIYLSLPENRKEYKDELLKLIKTNEDIGRKLVDISSEKLPTNVIDYDFFVTEYTLSAEKLTEKLFNITLSTDITEKELKFKGENITSASDELVKKISQINEESQKHLNNFISLINDLYNNVKKLDSFSYLYLFMLEYMTYEADSFKFELNRITSRSKTDPTEVAISEYYWNKTMLWISIFINKIIDIKDEEIFEESHNFISKFIESENIYKTSTLTPESQLYITNREYALVSDFRVFIKDLLDKIINKKLFLIVNPLFINTLYIDINFFIFRLYVNRKYGNIYNK